MNRFSHNIVRLVLALSIVMVSMYAVADRNHGKMVIPDSLTVRTQTWGEMNGKKMMQSAYPVKLSVKGNSLRVKSKYQQVLPIYTQTGSLYLTMRLNPGENWLNGLPRGRYRINNCTINIQ